MPEEISQSLVLKEAYTGGASKGGISILGSVVGVGATVGVAVGILLAP